MKNKILICAESMNIGGVETAIYNQAITLREKGFEVYIASESGSYTQDLIKNGIKFIDFKFEFLCNKTNEFIKIIKKLEINQVYIHKTICYDTAVNACFLLNIPYVIFLHIGLEKEYDWLVNSCNITEEELKVYFENAQKIVCITEAVKNYNMKKFKIKEEKYKIINNSINLSIFKSEENIKNSKLKNFLVISRMTEEKIVSVINSILQRI